MARTDIPSLLYIKKIEASLYRLRVKDLKKLDKIADKMIYRSAKSKKPKYRLKKAEDLM